MSLVFCFLSFPYSISTLEWGPGGRLSGGGNPARAGYGDRRGGGGGVAGGGTLVDGGGYLRNCVGGARTVCAATSPNRYGFSSGLMGSDDAGSLSSPRATRERVCEL